MPRANLRDTARTRRQVIDAGLLFVVDAVIFVLAAYHLYRTPVPSPYFMFFFLFTFAFGWSAIGDADNFVKSLNIAAGELLTSPVRTLLGKGVIAIAMVWITVKRRGDL